MTSEEMQTLIDTQTQRIADMEHDAADLEAERDSLRAELDDLKGKHAASLQELQETKRLNYTLARQIDAGPQNKTLEETLAEAF